jgi:hypothetical protein
MHERVGAFDYQDAFIQPLSAIDNDLSDLLDNVRLSPSLRALVLPPLVERLERRRRNSESARRRQTRKRRRSESPSPPPEREFAHNGRKYPLGAVMDLLVKEAESAVGMLDWVSPNDRFSKLFGFRSRLYYEQPRREMTLAAISRVFCPDEAVADLMRGGNYSIERVKAGAHFRNTTYVAKPRRKAAVEEPPPFKVSVLVLYEQLFINTSRLFVILLLRLFRVRFESAPTSWHEVVAAIAPNIRASFTNALAPTPFDLLLNCLFVYLLSTTPLTAQLSRTEQLDYEGLHSEMLSRTRGSALPRRRDCVLTRRSLPLLVRILAGQPPVDEEGRALAALLAPPPPPVIRMEHEEPLVLLEGVACLRCKRRSVRRCPDCPKMCCAELCSKCARQTCVWCRGQRAEPCLECTILSVPKIHRPVCVPCNLCGRCAAFGNKLCCENKCTCECRCVFRCVCPRCGCRPRRCLHPRNCLCRKCSGCGAFSELPDVTMPVEPDHLGGLMGERNAFKRKRPQRPPTTMDVSERRCVGRACGDDEGESSSEHSVSEDEEPEFEDGLVVEEEPALPCPIYMHQFERR